MKAEKENILPLPITQQASLSALSSQREDGHEISVNQIPGQSSSHPMTDHRPRNLVSTQSGKVSPKKKEQLIQKHTAAVGRDQADLSSRSFVLDVSTSFDPEREPVLRPQDLEDLANIFDRIRALHKKRVENPQSQKKLIAKPGNAKVDDLAHQFDKRLSEIMQKLASILKDRLVSTHQKHCEIEQAKFMLYTFCQDTCNKILAVQKVNMTPTDSKELHAIQDKVSLGLQTGFFNIGKLFYSRDDQEVRRVADSEVNRMRKQCHDYEELKVEHADACEQLSDQKDQLIELHQTCCEQADEITRAKQARENMSKKRDEQAAEISKLQGELSDLRSYRDKYDEISTKNKKLETDVERLEELVEEKDLEGQNLTKKLCTKEKELQRQTRLVSHLKEELREMREECSTLADENQKYLDMIIRQSLNPSGSGGARDADLKWLRRHILKGRRSVFLTQQHDWEYRSIVSPSASVSPALGKNPADFGQSKNNLSITQKSTLIQRRRATGSLLDGKSCSPFAGADHSAIQSPSRRGSLYVVDSPTGTGQREGTSLCASKAVNSFARINEVSRRSKSIRFTGGDGASNVTGRDTVKVPNLGPPRKSLKSIDKVSQKSRSQKGAGSLPPPPKSGYSKRRNYQKSMSRSQSRSPMQMPNPSATAFVQDDGTDATVALGLGSNTRSKALLAESGASKTAGDQMQAENGQARGQQEASAPQKLAEHHSSRTRALQKAPVIKQITQRSQENVTPMTQEGEELQRSAMKKLIKVESQIIEKSCTKGQFADESGYRGGAKPEEQHHMHSQKVLTSNGLALHATQSHMVSMQEVEPSGRKGVGNVKHYGEAGNTISQEEPHIDSRTIILAKDCIDSSIAHDDQINKKMIAQVVDLDHGSDPTRVPPLAFSGIGFSFNEKSQAAAAKQRASKVRSTTHSVSPSEAKKQSRLFQSDGVSQYQVFDRKQQDASTPRSKSLPETNSLAGVFPIQPMLGTLPTADLVMRTLGSQNETAWNAGATMPGCVNLSMAVTHGASTNKQIHEHIRRKLRRIEPDPRMSSVQLSSFGDSRAAYLSTSGNLMAGYGSFAADSIALERTSMQVRSPVGKSLNLNFKRGSNASSGGGKGHFSMSLNHLRDLIQDIYTQKIRHDDKCINMNKQNRETMEQFLCTYLSQKYGLKSLVMDQASAVIAAIGQYQEDCQEALLFGKVLRHQVDEEFNQEQVRLRASITHFLKQCYRERNPNKGQREILRLVADLESGKTHMEHWLWSKLLGLMFDSTDVFILQDKLRKVNQLRAFERTLQSANGASAHPQSRGQVLATDTRAEERRRSREHASRRSGSRYDSNNQNQSSVMPGKPRTLRGRTSSVQMTQSQNGATKFKFSDFVATLLSFQLIEHEKYLSHFLAIFRQIDLDNDGIVSNAEFVELCRRMNVCKLQSNDNAAESKGPGERKSIFQEEVNRLLDIVDPYQSDKITLSDVIQLFSNQKVETSTPLFATKQSHLSALKRKSSTQLQQDQNEHEKPLHQKYMVRSGREEDSRAGGMVGMETTDSNFMSYNYKVPDEEINAQSPMTSIVTRTAVHDQNKDMNEVADTQVHQISTFAPNSHATSKVALHLIPEEDIMQRTGEENVDLMTGDEAGSRAYNLLKMAQHPKPATDVNHEYLESLKKESEDEQRNMALKLGGPSIGKEEPANSEAPTSAEHGDKALQHRSARRSEDLRPPALHGFERKFSQRGHLGLMGESLNAGARSKTDLNDMALISEHEQRLNNEILELERKLGERQKQTSGQ